MKNPLDPYGLLNSPRDKEMMTKQARLDAARNRRGMGGVERQRPRVEGPDADHIVDPSDESGRTIMSKEDWLKNGGEPFWEVDDE